MNDLKKYPIEIEAERVLNTFEQHKKPIVNALNEYKEQMTKTKQASFIINLPLLIGYLTRVSKRKTIKSKYKDYKIGLNFKGLGYVGKWGSQLNPLCDDRDFEMLYNILTDEDLSLEIQNEIINSNRKTFLKVLNALKKTENPTDRKKEITIGEKLRIYFKDFETPSFSIDGSSIDWKLLSDGINNILDYGDFYFSVLTDAETLTEYSQEIVNALNEEKKELQKRTKQEGELNDFVLSMLNTFKAMENI